MLIKKQVNTLATLCIQLDWLECLLQRLSVNKSGQIVTQLAEDYNNTTEEISGLESWYEDLENTVQRPKDNTEDQDELYKYTEYQNDRLQEENRYFQASVDWGEEMNTHD